MHGLRSYQDALRGAAGGGEEKYRAEQLPKVLR